MSNFNDDLEIYWCDLGCEPVEQLQGKNERQNPDRLSNIGLVLVLVLSLTMIAINFGVRL